MESYSKISSASVCGGAKNRINNRVYMVNAQEHQKNCSLAQWQQKLLMETCIFRPIKFPFQHLTVSSDQLSSKLSRKRLLGEANLHVICRKLKLVRNMDCRVPCTLNS